MLPQAAFPVSAGKRPAPARGVPAAEGFPTPEHERASGGDGAGAGLAPYGG